MVHHRRGLRRLLRDDELLARLEADPDSEELGPRRRALLRYALKLTRTPDAMEPGDVEALRDAGYEDADVLGVAEVVAYFAYVNRIADGLGVQLEA